MDEVAENMQMREKTWDERDTNQKLELLRDFMRGVLIDLARHQEELARLACHQHSQHGQLVVPMDNYNPSGARHPRYYDPMK